LGRHVEERESIKETRPGGDAIKKRIQPLRTKGKANIDDNNLAIRKPQSCSLAQDKVEAAGSRKL